MKNLLYVLLSVCFILSSCGEEEIPPVPLPDFIEIRSQEDVDAICEILHRDSFYGNITVITKEELDYNCLKSLVRVNGDLFLEAPNIVKEFENIEIVADKLTIIDPVSKEIKFPNLTSVYILEIGCSNAELIEFGDLERIKIINIRDDYCSTDQTSSSLSLIKGFNNLTNLYTIIIKGGENDQLVIDGFKNLTAIGNLEFIIPSDGVITEGSFDKLEWISIGKFEFYNEDIDFGRIFPNLMNSHVEIKSPFTFIRLDQFCIYKEFIIERELYFNIYIEDTYYNEFRILEECQ